MNFLLKIIGHFQLELLSGNCQLEMSFHKYVIPVAFLVKIARNYNILMKIEFIALNPGFEGHIENGISALEPKFDEFVKKLVKKQRESDMADLFEWLYPAIKHESVTLDMVCDAISYSLLHLSIDGPIDNDLMRNMFTYCKNARSLSELNYMLRPEWLTDVPTDKWTDEMVDAFWATLRD